MERRKKEVIKIMVFKREGNIPKGRVVPMYLTDEGDLFSIVFTSEEQMDTVATMIGIAMEKKIVVDTSTQINDPKEKLCIYNLKNKKKNL